MKQQLMCKIVRDWRYLILSVGFILLFLGIGSHVEPLRQINHAVRKWQLRHPIEHPWLRRLLMATHFTGGGRIMTATVSFWSLLLWLLFDQPQYAFILAVTLTLQTFIVFLLKQYYGFERPLVGTEIMRTKSYPSGHTAAALTFLVLFIQLIAPLLPKFWQIVLIIVYAIHFVLTAYGRIALDVHWFTDVVGGLTVSGVFLFGLRAFPFIQAVEL